MNAEGYVNTCYDTSITPKKNLHRTLGYVVTVRFCTSAIEVTDRAVGQCYPIRRLPKKRSPARRDADVAVYLMSHAHSTRRIGIRELSRFHVRRPPRWLGVAPA